jgi:O-antigen/teichoic acid export membrane protein
MKNYIRYSAFSRALKFISGNIVAQASSAIAGLFLARWLSVHDYAIYTITMVLMGAATVLTKGGVHLAFTAILGRHWPNMQRASEAVSSALAARRLLSLLVLPPLLAASTFLLTQVGAGLLLTAALLVSLVVFWWADMRTRMIDQVLFFAKQTTRLQILDTVLGLARLATICGIYTVGWLSALTAVLAGVLVAVLRVAPVLLWIGRILPTTRSKPHLTDVREFRGAGVRQLPVDLFYIFQSQIIFFFLSVFGSTEHIAGFGALGRIAQLLIPVQAFSYAFCVPIFVRQTDRTVSRLIELVAICSVPSVGLILISAFFPSWLLWLIGSNYASLSTELLACSIATALNSVAGIAWTLVAHRGWNYWAWLQIPIGLIWCGLAARFINLGSIEGAFWIQAGFSIGLVSATLADLLRAYRRGEIYPSKII